MAVTKEQVAYWQAQMAKGVPEISEKAALRFKAVRATAVVAADNGVGIRLMSNEGDMAEVFLNPVVARHLLRQIGQAGFVGEWLDDSLDLKVVANA